ncbi:MAG: hypothetical protein HW391_689 [Chloroflexi bacterium]|nr:hypothetical protein [Chloroflexota bacterium]
MNRVIAIILHALPAEGAGPHETAFATARAANAARQARGFEAAGAVARIVETRPGGPAFGVRLRRLAALDPGAGFVVLGSGSVPLAGPGDRRAFVAAAAAGARGPVLTNNFYSSDIVALPSAVDLGATPDLAADNGLPRWLSGHGFEVRDLRSRWRLQIDLDSPLDVFVAGLSPKDDPSLQHVRDAAAQIRTAAASPGAELLVAGRTSAGTLGWLESATASRTRALVEERGLRTGAEGQRPPQTVLGLLLDRDGPDAFGRILAGLADAAVIDTRVLLGHRYGRDEAAWPSAEDRFASDLLLPDQIEDPWLAGVTRAAMEAPIPVLLGGHTLVGPGLRLLLGPRRQ